MTFRQYVLNYLCVGIFLQSYRIRVDHIKNYYEVHLFSYLHVDVVHQSYLQWHLLDLYFSEDFYLSHDIYFLNYFTLYDNSYHLKESVLLTVHVIVN